MWFYKILGRCWQELGQYHKAELVYLAHLSRSPGDYWISMDLAGLYMKEKKFAEAEEVYKTALEHSLKNFRLYTDYRLYEHLALCYDRRGKRDLAGEYRKKAEEARLLKYHPLTVRNYNEIVNMILEQKKKLVCMQYPLRNLDSLKKILADNKEIIFVDNEHPFEGALKMSVYAELFVDRFAFDFGHCTKEGNRMIAENLASVILQNLHN